MWQTSSRLVKNLPNSGEDYWIGLSAVTSLLDRLRLVYDNFGEVRSCFQGRCTLFQDVSMVQVQVLRRQLFRDHTFYLWSRRWWVQTLQRSGRRQFHESNIIISLNPMASRPIPMVHKTYSTWTYKVGLVGLWTFFERVRIDGSEMCLPLLITYFPGGGSLFYIRRISFSQLSVYWGDLDETGTLLTTALAESSPKY